MDENQKPTSPIIDSYDGDPGDFITFQTPDPDDYLPDDEDFEADSYSSGEEEVLYDSKAGIDEIEDFDTFGILDSSEPEVLFERPADSGNIQTGSAPDGSSDKSEQDGNLSETTEKLTASSNPFSEEFKERTATKEVDTDGDGVSDYYEFDEPFDGTKPHIPVVNGGKTGGSSGKVEGTINLKDPHYHEFSLDPYYDFGQGEEPEMPRHPKNAGGKPRKSKIFGIIAFATSFSGLSGCIGCGGWIFSIASVVMAILSLSQKNEEWNGGKTMAIIALIIDSLALMGAIAYFVYMGSSTFSSYFNSFGP